MPVEGASVLLGLTIGKRCAVSALGDEAGVLDFMIHTPLEGVVETVALVSDVFNASDLGFDANRELVTRIARQAEPLRVVGNQFEGHIFLSLMVSGHEKARSGVDRAFKSRNRVDTYSSQDIMAKNGVNLGTLGHKLAIGRA